MIDEFTPSINTDTEASVIGNNHPRSSSGTSNNSRETETQTDSTTANSSLDAVTRERIEKIKKNIGIVMDKPKSPNFAILAKRIETFRNVLISRRLDSDVVEKYALAGFVYRESRDLLECFHCSCKVTDWYDPCKKMEEDPWKIHVIVFPYCAHVRQCKTDRFILELLRDDELVALENDKTPIAVVLALERNKNAIEAARSIFEFTEAELHGAVEIMVCRQRMFTFNGEQLYCVIDSLRSNPKGTNTTDGNPFSTDTDKTNNMHACGDELTTDRENRDNSDTETDNVVALLEENERLKSDLLCKVCFLYDACIITLPCGHMVTCPQCISALDTCAICRSEVKGTVRALYASAKQ